MKSLCQLLLRFNSLKSSSANFFLLLSVVITPVLFRLPPLYIHFATGRARELVRDLRVCVCEREDRKSGWMTNNLTDRLLWMGKTMKLMSSYTFTKAKKENSRMKKMQSLFKCFIHSFARFPSVHPNELFLFRAFLSPCCFLSSTLFVSVICALNNNKEINYTYWWTDVGMCRCVFVNGRVFVCVREYLCVLYI